MRAIETAKIVIKTAGIEQEVQSMEILDEMDPGVLSGKHMIMQRRICQKNMQYGHNIKTLMA